MINPACGNLGVLARWLNHDLALRWPHRLFSVALLIMGVLASTAAQAKVLSISPGADRIDLWPSARVLFDGSEQHLAGDLLATPQQFEPHGAYGSNLGRRAGAVWIRVDLAMARSAASRWMLDIDYASLDRVEVWVYDGMHLEQHAELGDHVPKTQRPLPSRAHVLPLDLPAGAERTLLMRVSTTGSLIVPLTLSSAADYLARETEEQALQGLLAGMGLCLLLYSLAQWIMLRDLMFGLYAVTLLGTCSFFAALSGVGPQHVWGNIEWLALNGPPFSILLGVGGAFFFVLRALDVAAVSPRVARVVQGGGLVALATAGAFVFDLIGYATAQGIGMALGPAPLLLVLPTAFQRLRTGDRGAGFILAGWGFYSVGSVVIVSLLKGWVPVNFWTLHGFQFASMVEMTMWLFVLGERVQAIRKRALVVQAERDHLQVVSESDPLTGLLNRRGLLAQAPAVLASATAQQPLAVYLLDLDGFKPVNDRWGHDIGDALLRSVAQRLRATLRNADLICRLGGDEFVVMAPGLSSHRDAQAIGQKLLAAFGQTFNANGIVCPLGVTIGYALAPQDDSGIEGLLKRADAAMYTGKQAGRGVLMRGSASPGLSVI